MCAPWFPPQAQVQAPPPPPSMRGHFDFSIHVYNNMFLSETTIPYENTVSVIKVSRNACSCFMELV